MRLLPSLLRRVYRALNPDPTAFVAMHIAHPVGGTWHVRDAVLTLQANSTPPPPPAVIPLAPDGTPITLRQLAALIEAAGWTVSDLDTARAGRAAIALIETEAPRGSAAMQAHNSLLWALFDAYALELDIAATAATAAPDQMAPQTAEGFWLDELGRYYGVPRLPDEADTLYAPRIVEEVLRPKSNNLAMAAIIEATTGQPTTVTDVTVYRNPVPAYDGLIQHDGTYTYSATDQAVYGLFDVDTTFNLLGAGNIVAFKAAILAQIERLRAAGTMLRNITVAGGDIPEPAPGPIADAVADTSAAIDATETAPPAADTDLAPTSTTEITDAASNPADTDATHAAAIADIADDPSPAADTEQSADADIADFPEGAGGPSAEDIADTVADLDATDATTSTDTAATHVADLDDYPDAAPGPTAEAIANTTAQLDDTDAVTATTETITVSKAAITATESVTPATEAGDVGLSHDLTLDGAWTLSGTRALGSGLTLTEPL